MISGHDFYAIMTAMVPLYVAMFLAYGSVNWWKIFTPDQCSGINRFVAIFAVPLLSFHFISMNDPYTMNFRFLAADTLQKIIMLLVLGLWAKFTKTGSLEWVITIFSLSTLPNTLVIGIPLLSAMYGDFSASLMVQLVVMQCIIWYTLLLVFFEFRGAKMLIMEQFPGSGADIVSIKVDSDVVSLDGQDCLETATEIGDDGKLHVTVRKSNASRRSIGVASLSGAEIYSISSSAIQTPRGSNFNQSDFYSITGFPGGRLSNFGPAADVYSFQPSLGKSPRRSSVLEDDQAPVLVNMKSSKSGFYHAARDMGGSRVFVEGANSENFPSVTKRQQPPQMPLSSKPPQQSGRQNKANHDVHVFPRKKEEFRGAIHGEKERIKLGLDSAAEHHPETVAIPDEGSGEQMPSAGVMIRLILMMVWRKLIRNPNTYASIIGLIWSLVSFRWHVGMPKIIENSISLISKTGLGMAMFSLGLFMALQPKIIACGKSKAALAMAVKFLIGPLVMAVAAMIVGLRGNLLRVSIVQATLSEGIVPFVFAKEYNVHPTILSTAVIFGMLITVNQDK
ncbi:hypothetical protein L1887_30691 [Cichorium endivia]|nr:hypothetical protein L1887_30691 [Cichorium endivia]